MKIEGKIQYQKLSGGFWGIIDQGGKKWRPTKLPKKMRQEGLVIKATIKEVSTGEISIFMWGTSIEILEFEIIG